MERGEGLLGELTSDSESGRRLKASLDRHLGVAGTDRHQDRDRRGPPGPAAQRQGHGRPALRRGRPARFGPRRASENGPGLAPALINDPQMKAGVQDTLAQLNQAAQELRQIHRRPGDERRPAAPPGQRRGVRPGDHRRRSSSSSDQLNEISVKLDRGDGTAAKLINDPQVYDAVNDIVIGVNESRLLRWLIRNRQKAGIRSDTDTRKDEGRRPDAAAARRRTGLALPTAPR